MKITFNNYMNGYNNTIYSNNSKNSKCVNVKNKSKDFKEAISEAKKETVKNNESIKNSNIDINKNIVNNEVNLENNMLYYYRSQELKRKRNEFKEEKVTRVSKI